MIGGYWEKNLIAASLGGVDFPMRSRSMTGGRRTARAELPYRSGQGIEDLGRAPSGFELRIPLYRGMATAETADALYPGTLDRLLGLIDDEDVRGEVEYVDPEYGPFNVKIVNFSWDADAERRDGGELTLSLEERGFDQSILDSIKSKPGMSARARAMKAATKVDYLLASLLSRPDATKNGSAPNDDVTLANAWSKLNDLLDAGAMALDDIASQIDSVTFMAERIMALDAGDELERWSIVNSCLGFVSAARDVAEQSNESPGDRMIDFVTPSQMSMHEIASALYGDSVRAEEISMNNPTTNPMAYPAGSRLRVFAR